MLGTLRTVFLICLSLSYAAAQTRVPWRNAPESGSRLSSRSWRGRHLVLEFSAQPDEGVRAALRARGVRVLHDLPGMALLVASEGEIDTADLHVTRAEPMPPSAKVSRLLKEEGGFFLAQFHPDVDMNEARALVISAGLAYRENPDLRSTDLLVSGTSAQRTALASWEEVAYLFPVSDRILKGQPVAHCDGAALVSNPMLGEYIATYGDGWDGPGQHAAALQYFYSGGTTQLSAADAMKELQRAMTEWGKYAQITFQAATSATAPKTINILFAKGDHGDGSPFDSALGILAHGFYPSPPNPEPIAGDLHFDDAETWVNSRYGINLYSVALHELGHTLGLGHSDDSTAVMYAYYHDAAAGLQTDDIASIRKMYAAVETPNTPNSPPTPTTPPATPPTLTLKQPATDPTISTGTTATLAGTATGEAVKVAWTNDKGARGTASGTAASWKIASVPLQLGDTVFTITATDGSQQAATKTIKFRRTDAVVPKLTVVSPAAASSTTTENRVTISGTAVHASGILSVTYTGPNNLSGTATGTDSWSIGPLTLVDGANRFVITARSRYGAVTTRTIDVRKFTDVTAPVIAVTTPSSATFTTSAAKMTIVGTARDNVATTGVTWTSSAGTTGTATGLERWTIPDLALIVGANTVAINATDAAGNKSKKMVTITRK